MSGVTSSPAVPLNRRLAEIFLKRVCGAGVVESALLEALAAACGNALAKRLCRSICWYNYSGVCTT